MFDDQMMMWFQIHRWSDRPPSSHFSLKQGVRKQTSEEWLIKNYQAKLGSGFLKYSFDICFKENLRQNFNFVWNFRIFKCCEGRKKKSIIQCYNKVESMLIIKQKWHLFSRSSFVFILRMLWIYTPKVWSNLKLKFSLCCFWIIKNSYFVLWEAGLIQKYPTWMRLACLQWKHNKEEQYNYNKNNIL